MTLVWDLKTNGPSIKHWPAKCSEKMLYPRPHTHAHTAVNSSDINTLPSPPPIPSPRPPFPLRIRPQLDTSVSLCHSSSHIDTMPTPRVLEDEVNSIPMLSPVRGNNQYRSVGPVQFN